MKGTAFEKLTWPEVNECVREDRIVLLPVGQVEQHGPALPLDTDMVGIVKVCELASQKEPGLFVVMPPVYYGYSEHDRDFPGTISIKHDHLIGYCYDICESLVRHGFKRILLLNGHGGNRPILDIVSRMVVAYTDALAATVNIWNLSRDEMRSRRESAFPGGMSHACEYEASIYLACGGECVKQELFAKEMGEGPALRWFWGDLAEDSPVKTMDKSGRITRSGVCGDPTFATFEKGEAFISASVDNLIDLGKEFRSLAIGPRVSHILSDAPESKSK